MIIGTALGMRGTVWAEIVVTHKPQLTPGVVLELGYPFRVVQKPECQAFEPTQGPVLNSGWFPGMVGQHPSARGISGVGFILGLVAFNIPGR